MTVQEDGASAESGSPDADERVVVVPFGGDKTRRADRLQLVALTWAIAVLIGAAAIHPGAPAFVALALVAFLPTALLQLPTPILRRIPGSGALIPESPYRVEFDRHGLTFGAPEISPHQVPWDAIERMDVDQWCWGRLIARDGTLIAAVQPALVRLPVPKFRSPSLAVYAVRTRPDLFVPSQTTNRFTQPYGFERPSPGHEAPDLAAIERRQTALEVAFCVLAILVVLIIVILVPAGGSR